MTIPVAVGAPLGVVKKTEEDLLDACATERGFMQIFGRYNDEPLALEDYQVEFLRTPARFRCVEKSRQVGYSWVFAIEALARSHLRETHTGVFVSYNLADAKEKITYCHQMHEELPLEYQKKLVVESKLELGFRSNTKRGRVSRIISNPSKAPRGKKGDIYLDELAHCANDRDIYKGSTALVLRAAGQLTVCSSPLGRRGVFWEIARQEIVPYRAYWRQGVPWWLCSFLCNNVPMASLLAPSMATADRVARFGKTNLKDQFSSLLLEDFQQEFEVLYSDEAMTFFPYELIIPCTEAELELYEDFAELAKVARGRLVAGYDIGRKRDLSVLVIFEETSPGFWTQRMMIPLERVPFAQQEDKLRAMLALLKVARVSIDSNGIGMQLAENLSRDFPGVVVSEEFTTVTKEVWANDFKIHLQRKSVKLVRDRDLIAQIHSIKKNVTDAGRVTFEAEKNPKTKGHADAFWACAIALQKERKANVRPSGTVGVRIIGD